MFAMVAAVYGRLAADKRGVAKAHVRTAAPLSPESSARLESDLRVFLESLGGRSKFAICY